MHRTLGSMLRKAAQRGLDAAARVLFVMLALRSTPGRDTGLFPFEFIYGR